MVVSRKKESIGSKLAIGCGLVLAVAILLVGFISYLGFKFSGGALSGIKEMTAIVTLDRNIVNQSDFVPPEDGLMSLEQVRSLVYIQTEIKDAFGSNYKELMLEYRSFVSELEDASDVTRFRELISMSHQLLSPLHHAKEAQIEAINRESISLKEYEWLQSQAIVAFDLPVHRVNIHHVINNLKGIESGSSVESKERLYHSSNKDLLEPHRLVLSETLILTALGL